MKKSVEFDKKIRNSLGPSRLFLNSLDSALAREYRRSAVMMDPYRGLHDGLAFGSKAFQAAFPGSAQALYDAARQQDLLRSSGLLELSRNFQGASMCAAGYHPAFVDKLNLQAVFWARMLEPGLNIPRYPQHIIPGIHEAFLAWDQGVGSLFQRFQDVRLLNLNEDLATRLLEPSRVFTRFVRETSRMSARGVMPDVANRMSSSIGLAAQQFVSISDVVSSIAELPAADIPPSIARSLSLPIAQRAELLVLQAGQYPDESELIDRSTIATVANKAKGVLRLVIQCNEAAKVSGRKEIFKPTTRLLEAFADFIWLLPRGKRSFADFVDCLYYIFYEGAGTDNLRFLRSNGGPLDINECEFIWSVKHLRNKWGRHDPDHGDPASVRTSWRDLSAKFDWLGLKHYPIISEDFRFLHRRLLEQAEGFLKKTLVGLTRNP